MTSNHAPRRRRPRWRAYLLLSRVSNLPTIWSNVLAGVCAGAYGVGTAGDLSSALYVRLAVAVSLFYTAGMFLNDAFDEPFDRRQRPERPIPAGDVSRGEVYAVGLALMIAGELLLPLRANVWAIGLLLAGAIVLYDARHKGVPLAPLVMGSCRALVYLLAAAAAGAIGAAAWTGAVIMLAYVAGLTVVAKMAGPHARWLVPALIAGISLVDAVFVGVVSASPALALLAALGFPLTLFLQRFVPGD